MAEDSKSSESFDETGPIAAALGRHEAAAVGILLLFAALFRALRWSAAAVIFNDGPIFIRVAQAWAEGDWAGALSHDYHPLYPVLIAGAHAVIADWELAAVAVSLIGGTAAVGCLYGFARAAFGRPAAFAAGALLAVHPYAIEFSGDVQSEGLYMGLFLGAVWALWLALRSASLGAASVAGLLSGLAYLTRPEGIGLLVVGGVFAAWFALRRSWSPRRTAAWGALLFLTAAAVAGPYVVWLRVETDAWSLTQKKSIGSFVGLSETAAPVAHEAAPAPAAPEGRASQPVPPAKVGAETQESAAPVPGAQGRFAHDGTALLDLLHTDLRALRPEIFAVLVAGALIGRWRRLSLRGVYVLVIVGAYNLVLYSLALNVGYVSARHALPPLTVAFGHVGAALVAVVGALSGPRRWIALVLIFLAIAGIGLSKSLRPDRTDSLAERSCAEWLRAQDLPPGGVAVHRLRIAYYAGAHDVRIPHKPLKDVVAKMRKWGAEYLIISDEDIVDYPWLVEALPGRSRLLHREKANGVSASVYLLLPKDHYFAEPKPLLP
jgi:4-amino-4-deoxy-L-arabinose transferase-like glycosyltransferase